MICEICGRYFTTISYLYQRKQHSENVDNYKCSFCQILFLRSFNLKRHLRLVHSELNVEKEMEDKRRIERKKFQEMKKLVYVLSHLYEDISSDEEMCTSVTHLIESDDLEAISVCTDDFDFVEKLLEESDSVCDDRAVITKDTCIKETEDTREVILSDHSDRETEGDHIPSEEP